MTEPTPLLSSGTSAKINWSKILDQTAGLRVRSGGAPTTVAESAELEKYRERVPQVFAHVKEEFAHASAHVDGHLRMLRILKAGLVVLIIGSGVLAAVNSTLWGTIVSGGGLAALFAIFVQTSKLSRDQVMLAQLPKNYEMALQLATSPEHFRQILDRFLQETTPLRDK